MKIKRKVKAKQDELTELLVQKGWKQTIRYDEDTGKPYLSFSIKL